MTSESFAAGMAALENTCFGSGWRTPLGLMLNKIVGNGEGMKVDLSVGFFDDYLMH